MTVTYEGAPCKRCGGTTRYAKNRECMPCRQAKASARYVPKPRSALRSVDGVTYRGIRCPAGHNGLRYLSNNSCVECVAANLVYDRACAFNAMCATMYPKEFDEMGISRSRREMEE